MKRWRPFLLCLMLPATFAHAEEAGAPALSLSSGGEVTGDFDEPACTNP